MAMNRAGKVIARPKWQANSFMVCSHKILDDLVEKSRLSQLSRTGSFPSNF